MAHGIKKRLHFYFKAKSQELVSTTTKQNWKKMCNFYVLGFRFFLQAAGVHSFHLFACWGFLSSQILNLDQKATQKSLNSVNLLQTSGFDMCDSRFKSEDVELLFKTAALHSTYLKNSFIYLIFLILLLSTHPTCVLDINGERTKIKPFSG